MLAHEVEHRTDGLAFESPQPTAQLLQKECGAIRRSEKQNRINGRDVDAFVEEVDGKHDVYSSVFQILQGTCSFSLGRVCPYGRRLDSRLVEDARHVSGVSDAHAKPEGPNHGRIARAAIQFLQHDACVSVVYRQHFSKALDVVPTAASPRHVSKIGVVVNSVVDKRCQPMLVNCVPKPKLGSDAVTEP